MRPSLGGLIYLSLRDAEADVERLTRERNAARREVGRLGQSRGARSVVDVISQVLRGEQAAL